jgi:hypothetical protein
MPGTQCIGVETGGCILLVTLYNLFGILLILLNSDNLWCVFVQFCLVFLSRSQAERLLEWISQHESSSTPCDDCDTDTQAGFGGEILVSLEHDVGYVSESK